MTFSQCWCPQDIKAQCWTDEESDGENESEQFLYGIQVQQRHRIRPYSVNLCVQCGICPSIIIIFFTFTLPFFCLPDTIFQGFDLILVPDNNWGVILLMIVDILTKCDGSVVNSCFFLVVQNRWTRWLTFLSK